jgi:D-glycero-D-manno-heptose 1,7-bisphosphate phosphatase
MGWMLFSHHRPTRTEFLPNKAPEKRKAVFLDRDGTIIEQVELLHVESEIKVLPGAAQAIREMNEMGYLVIMVSNQPVVARGIVEPEEVDCLNGILMDRLAKEDARIDAGYFCPHHPKANLEIYRMTCVCRKPDPGMMIEAAKDYNVDLSKSFLVGDSTQDTLAGNRAGVKVILVETGYGGKDPWQHEGKPYLTAKDLLGAAQVIKKISKNK